MVFMIPLIAVAIGARLGCGVPFNGTPKPQRSVVSFIMVALLLIVVGAAIINVITGGALE